MFKLFFTAITPIIININFLNPNIMGPFSYIPFMECNHAILSMRSKCENASLTEMVDIVLNDSGLREELTGDKSLESEIRLENLEEFKSITKSYEEEFGVISLSDFLNEISLVSDISEHQDGTNKVNLMTIHAVKGLEFDNVFVKLNANFPFRWICNIKRVITITFSI